MPATNRRARLAQWSSPDFVDALSPRFLSRFKLLGAHAAKVTVAAGSIVEAIDVCCVPTWIARRHARVPCLCRSMIASISMNRGAVMAHGKPSSSSLDENVG